MPNQISGFEEDSSSIYDGAPSIAVPIPARDSRLYGRKGTDELLYFLANHPHDEFTITQLADLLSLNGETTRRAVNVLEGNDLVVVEESGKARLVQINRQRLDLPGDPVVRIPQVKFQDPVRAAVDALTTRLEDIVAIILYGSVARGEADRQSDIDLWVLVDDTRLRNQNRAHEVANELEDRSLDGDRYDFHIAVESVNSVPSYTRDVQEVVSSGFLVYRTEKYDRFETHLNNLARDD